jgi:signal transduction histidine kinase
MLAQAVTLVLTGYASLQSAIGALREGAYDYLIKPCDVEKMKATVARAVESGSLARSLRQRLAELDAANTKLESFNEELRRRVQEATSELALKVTELDHARHRLEEEQHRREEFISMIAHELGQPLTTISGYAQLLGRSNASAEVQERVRAAILSQTRRVARLVQDLADVAHLAAGRFCIYPFQTDLARLVEEQVELAPGPGGTATILVDVSPVAVPVGCDHDRIAQAVSNFLSNALKYAPGAEIRVSLRVDDHWAIVAVADRGPGIAADDLMTVFEQLVRLPSNHKERLKGMGLGLYIARAIIEAHGGQIWAASAGPNQGTTSTFTLPLQ